MKRGKGSIFICSFSEPNWPHRGSTFLFRVASRLSKYECEEQKMHENFQKPLVPEIVTINSSTHYYRVNKLNNNCRMSLNGKERTQNRPKLLCKNHKSYETNYSPNLVWENVFWLRNNSTANYYYYCERGVSNYRFCQSKMIWWMGEIGMKAKCRRVSVCDQQQ